MRIINDTGLWGGWSGLGGGPSDVCDVDGDFASPDSFPLLKNFLMVQVSGCGYNLFLFLFIFLVFDTLAGKVAHWPGKQAAQFLHSSQQA